MRYWGGKWRSADTLSPIMQHKILTDEGDSIEYYVEPMCGGMSVMERMAPFCETRSIECIASDGCEDLIMLWNEVQKGTFKEPGTITKEMWYDYKYRAEHSALRAYIGF